jgi:hypothetical protein
MDPELASLLSSGILRACAIANDLIEGAPDRRLRGQLRLRQNERALAAQQRFQQVDSFGPSLMRDRRALANAIRPYLFEHAPNEAQIAVCETQASAQVFLLAVGEPDGVSCDRRRLVPLLNELEAKSLMHFHSHFASPRPSDVDRVLFDRLLALRHEVPSLATVDAAIVTTNSAWFLRTGRTYPRRDR